MNNLVRRVASMGIQKAAMGGGSSSSSMLSHMTLPTRAMNPHGSHQPLAWISPLATHRLCFSTTTSEVVTAASSAAAAPPQTSTVFTDESTGQQYGMLLDTRKLPKLKPSVVRKRLANCKTYVGNERTIRQSPWKLNRICQLAAGLTLEEALTQLQFCDLKNADLVAKVLKRTSNLSDIRDGVQMSQLEVAECFVTKSMMLRRMKMMGRGRSGVMHHKFSNIRVVLREIDFPLRIYQQKSLNQKKKWLQHQHRSELDAQAAKAKRDETKRLERQQEEQLQERKAANN